jgi:Trk K+ transport system NAD-binding subunit
VRLTEYLVIHHGVSVTTIVYPHDQQVAMALADIDSVHVIETLGLDERVLQTADIAAADAVAVLLDDDAAAVRTAMMIEEIATSVRLVVRMKDLTLARGIEGLFRDGVVLSDAAEAVPALIAAAYGEPPPTPLFLFGRILVVARRADVDPADTVCDLATTPGPDHEALLLPNSGGDIVLAVTGVAASAASEDLVRSSSPPNRRSSPRRSRRRFSVRVGDWMRGRRMKLLLFAVGLFFLCVAMMAAALGTWDLVHAAHQTLLTVVNSGAESTSGGIAGLVRVLVYIAGAALLLPALSAIILTPEDDVLKLLRWVLPAPRLTHHLVIVGLGVMGRLAVHRIALLGVSAVAIERDETAPGVAMARHAGIPVVIGDANDAYVLDQASVSSARALLCLASDDIVNLLVALHGRHQNPDLRVVVRMFDGDLATHVRRRYGLPLTLSTSYLAAPSFALAMLGESNIATIPVGRRLLLLVDVLIVPASPLLGKTVGSLQREGHCRVIAHRTMAGDMSWSGFDAKVLAPNDMVGVVVTRAALAELLGGRSPA